MNVLDTGVNGRGHAILHTVASEGPLESLRLLVDLCEFAVSPPSTMFSSATSWAVAAVNVVKRKTTDLLGLSGEHTWISRGRDSCKAVAEARDQYALPRPPPRNNSSPLLSGV
eukprot:COSAG02_NODE_6846_length_3329_cov_6.995356_5_plen_113_part_00